MTQDQIEKIIERTGEHSEMNVWEKEGKVRIYVEKNKYDRCGYICFNASDAKGRYTGEKNGLFYSATRPGHVNFLEFMIGEITSN